MHQILKHYKFNKIIIIILLLIISTAISHSKITAQTYSYTSPDIKGETAVLMEAESGKVLFEQDKHEQMNPASTTKIMTALMLIENASLRDKVTVSENAYGTKGSTMFLNIEEKISIRDLLYGIMVNSANDAAVAIAEHLEGSVEEFADSMNERAEELGATNTNFTNPHGLTEDGHKTTAHDLAVIAREAIQNPKLRTVMSTRMTTLDWPDNDEDRELINRNELLREYTGAFGIKTGYTASANQTFVAAAERDDMTLIAVVLSSSRDKIFQDAEKLLDYGFDNYQQAELLDSGEIIASTEIPNASEDTLDLIVAESLKLPLPQVANEIEQQLSLKENPLTAPIDSGQKVGEVTLDKRGEQLATLPVYTANEVTEQTLIGPWLFIALIFLIIIFLIIKRYKANTSRKKVQERIKTRYRANR